jgi:predicted metal-dependent peptidase
MATDARAIYFNPGYVARLNLAELQFVLAHEALHCALGHFARRTHRERRRWDVATDHAVNWLLADDGLKPPPGVLLNPAFRGLAAEEIYPLVPSEPEENLLDRHLYDGAGAPRRADEVPASRSRSGGWQRAAGADGSAGGGDGAASESWDDAGGERRLGRPAGMPAPELEAFECDELARKWQVRLAAAAQQARRAGWQGPSWLRAIGVLIQPEVPWRSLLARFMLSVARDDYSFQRWSRRGGDALLPGLKSGEVDLHVALDTSGSIGDAELRQFTAEIDALKGQIRARVTVHACDETLATDGPWTFQAWEPIALPRELHGGGGTSFVPVFHWIERRHLRPDLLVYFTDAEGEFPAAAPGYPVIWVVKGTGAVPWGERIQLD